MSLLASASRPILADLNGADRNVAAPALVGNHAAQGALWTISFSILNKVGTIASQVALAWFLFPKDFGLVAMALSVTSFASMVCGANLRTILIQQQDDFASKASQVFWLSLAMNATVASLVMAFSPVAELMFKAPGVAGLIVIAALAIPVQGLTTIYSAALYRDLKFRTISTLNLCTGLIQNGSAVLFAWLGFGPYSLILPLVVMAVSLAILFRWKAGCIQITRPEPRLWPALLAPTVWIMVNSLFAVMQNYGPNFVLGLSHNATVTGYYYWGFALASQAVYLVATNLQGVFFPVLSKLNDDPGRQYEAVRKASQTLTVVIVPVCILQLLLARPLIQMVFHDRWLPSIAVVQWLSVGMLTQPLSILASAVLLAKGKFRLLAGITAGMALSVTLAAIIGSQFGQQGEIARWTGLCLFFANLAAGWAAFRQMNQGCTQLFRSIAWPLAFGVPAALLSWWAAGQTKNYGPAPQMFLVGAVCLGFYGFLVKTFFREVSDDVMRRIRSSCKI
jgi:O-antigen/teichoic acid export membrane protein